MSLTKVSYSMIAGSPANSRDFGVVGDGVTDDTLALISAMTFCKANGKELVIDGQVVFNATTASGSTHLISGQPYVYACSMVGNLNAELLVNGKIGFDLTGIENTQVVNLIITTSGSEISEVDATGSAPYLFYSGAGSKTSSLYRDLIIYHTVTNLTGAYRGAGTIVDNGCATALVDNVKVSNTTLGVFILNSTDVSIRNIYTDNVETSIFLDHVDNFQVTNLHHINTDTQHGNWASKNVGRLQNGMDGILTQYCNNGTIIGLHVVWALERACYIQASNVHISDCYALNCDGYKVVGSSLATFSHNAVISNCHVTIESDFPTSIEDLSLVAAYLGSDLTVQDCTFNNIDGTKTRGEAAIVIGLGASTQTYENVYIQNVVAINMPKLVWVITGGIEATSGGVLINPLAIKNVKILDCYLKCIAYLATEFYGALFSLRNGGYNNNIYSAQDIEIRDNTVDFDSDVNLRPQWLFDIRWMNGVTSSNNFVNGPFSGGGMFSSAVPSTEASTGILMNEPWLKSSINTGTLVNQFANFSALAGTSLVFTLISATTTQVVSTNTIVSGSLLDGNTTIEIIGKDYSEVTTTRSYAVEMNSSGLFYFGKIIAGVKTDQVSTPPIAITIASNIAIRGEATPTVKYYCKLTLV